MTEKFTSCVPGPRGVLRPAVPCVPAGATEHAASVEPPGGRRVIEGAKVARRDEIDAVGHEVSTLADVRRRHREGESTRCGDDPCTPTR
mgnify:CR=1 FL=1